MADRMMKAAVKEKSAPKSTVVKKVPIPKPLPDEVRHQPGLLGRDPDISADGM